MYIYVQFRFYFAVFKDEGVIVHLLLTKHHTIWFSCWSFYLVRTKHIVYICKCTHPTYGCMYPVNNIHVHCMLRIMFQAIGVLKEKSRILHGELINGIEL